MSKITIDENCTVNEGLFPHQTMLHINADVFGDKLRIDGNGTTGGNPDNQIRVNGTSENNPNVKNYGWICPVCGRGNAPWNPTCSCNIIGPCTC